MSLKDISTSGELLVVEGNAKPLLSRSTAKSCGVLRVNANYVAGQDEFSDQHQRHLSFTLITFFFFLNLS